MAMIYRCVGILTVDVVVFFPSTSVLHSQDSFPSTFRPRLWETSSGVIAVGVFAAEACRELWAHPPRLHLIYVVHAYCCYVIGRFLYRCFLWSEVLLCTFLMQDTKFYVMLQHYYPRMHREAIEIYKHKNNFNKKEEGLKIHKTGILQ